MLDNILQYFMTKRALARKIPGVLRISGLSTCKKIYDNGRLKIAIIVKSSRFLLKINIL